MKQPVGPLVGHKLVVEAVLQLGEVSKVIITTGMRMNWGRVCRYRCVHSSR
jgi:hypothetical protein